MKEKTSVRRLRRLKRMNDHSIGMMNEAEGDDDSEDWKVTAVERLFESLPRELVESDVDETADLHELVSSEGFQDRAQLRLLRTVFPTLDFAALENGASASQFGAFVGHLKVLVNQFERMGEVITECRDKVVDGVAKVEESRQQVPPELQPEVLEQVGQWFDAVKAAGPAMEELKDIMDQVVLGKRAMEEAVETCMAAAARQGGTESSDFFRAFGKAFDSPVLDANGQFVANPKMDMIYSTIMFLGDSVHSVATSVPELHAILAQMLGGRGLLTRDKESLQWDKDKKTVEGICRSLNLKFRKRGRPKKEQNTE